MCEKDELRAEYLEHLQDINDSPDEEEKVGKYGNCPCGHPLNDDNYGGNGYCVICAPDH